MSSRSDVTDVVRKAAVDSGATGELLAILLRHLPSLLWETQAANLEVAESSISLSVTPQYEIWTAGAHRIVQDINYYERKKDQYLFWIPLDAKKHRSPEDPEKTIGPRAIALLLYLVEQLGTRTKFEQVVREVWNDEPHGDAEMRRSQQNQLEQQLTKLEQFCDGAFRRYLFADKFGKGIGLDKAFADKYFIFRRLS